LSLRVFEEDIEMKNKLILHIGTPKSGTTSLQEVFAANRAKLSTQGVIYPRSFGSINLINLTLAFSPFKPRDPFFQRHRINSHSDQLALRRELDKNWLKERRKNSENHVVLISNEHLYTRMRSLDGLKEMKQWLQKYFDPIEVVVGLRPQIDLLVSNASQMARLGHKVDSSFFDDMDARKEHGFLNYNLGITPWLSVFGISAVTPVPFKRNPDIISYFSNKMGNLSLDRDLALNTNPALGWKAIAISNMLITQQEGKGTFDRGVHKKYLAMVPESEPLQVGIKISKFVTHTFRSENEKLVKIFNNIEISDFDPDWKKYDKDYNLYLIDAVQECFDFVTRIEL
jgi:hypothetical protein